MIRRIRERRAFERLARDGKRIRGSVLWCTWCPDSDATTSVAFAFGRALGPAVTRNRLRRRVRALLRELDGAGQVPPGLMLIGARPPVIELTFDQLRVEMTRLLHEVNRACSAGC